MTEIGVHLKDVIVMMFQRPFETGDVGGSQPQLAFAFYHEQAFGEFLLQSSDNGGSTVRRTVFDNKDMEYFFQGENGADDIFDVLPFVVCGNDNDAVRCLHIHKKRILIGNKVKCFLSHTNKTKDYLVILRSL